MVTKEEVRVFNEMLSEKSDTLLHPSIKDFIKDQCLATLESEYEKVIMDPKCTEEQALEYILLFSTFGNWIAAILGCTMDEYYMATDVFIDLVGLSAESDSNDLSQKRD